MNSFLTRLTLVLAAGAAWTGAQSITYTNFIRQIQQPTGVQMDLQNLAAISPDGGSLSPLAINPGGAQFQLWTVSSSPLTNYLLDTKYVGSYGITATVAITSQDPYALIPRTRCDRPFYVNITVTGLSSVATDPAAAKSVTLYRYVQSYGTGGTGVGIDRAQATLYSQASLTTAAPATLTYTVTSVPGADRTKVRGEERFSISTLADYQAPASQIASQYIQFWPVADGSITGITQGQVIRNAMPQATLTLNDLYPNSTTYAQVYKGSPALGTVGTVVPGSNLVISDSIPGSRILLLSNYDAVLPSDGLWTMEILTVTPFGTDRLAYLSFTLARTINLNGSFTTIE